MYSQSAACKALFCSVIVQAFKDALLYKNPRSYKETVSNNKKRVRRKTNGFITFRKMVKTLVSFLLKNFSIIERKDIVVLVVLSIWHRVEKILDHDPQDFEAKSYLAREFLDVKNSAFVWYCEMASIDPSYAVEKINKHIKLFDCGSKNSFKNFGSAIDIIKVNAL